MTAATACPACLRRSWLLGRLCGHLDVARSRARALLELDDDDLIGALSGDDAAAVRAGHEAFRPEEYGARCAASHLEVLCRCDPRYPARLRSLPAPPAVLHVAGGLRRFLDLAGADAVAIVGARAASPYGLENARSLARGVAASGLTVVSGMARGIDAAAHEGALESGGATIAVLAAAPQRAYPSSRRWLHRRILTGGSVVSELGPEVAVRRWMFPARNRIIAALARMTVLVAAGEGSGAMLTARDALSLGRVVGAVPGPVTARLSWGPHQLLRAGAHLVAEPADVLRALFGDDAPVLSMRERPSLSPRLQPVFDALADGCDPPRAFAQAGLDAEGGLAALAALELQGHIRRQPGGRFSIVS